MIDDCLKIAVYFGEREQHGRRLLADVLLDEFERSGLRTSILLRGSGGFGQKHRLQTDGLLTLSEDLPIVAIGVDSRARAEPLAERLRSTVSEGLLTVERARLVSAEIGELELPADLGDETKLTIYCGRAERAAGRPAAIAIVDLLHRLGVAGATVLLGVDGTLHGRRHRARFFSRNPNVPLMIASVGSSRTIAAALPELAALLDRPLLTLERVQVLKRDGKLLGELGAHPDADEARGSVGQKLTIYSGEGALADGRPLSLELLRRLRASGASGATSVRGVWGYHGDHAPHGDRLSSLRRHVPVVTMLVDPPSRIRQCWPAIDEATRETGLVTSELVFERPPRSPRPAAA